MLACCLTLAAWTLSPLLLFVALPPVIVVQRSLVHQQLKTAARTDAKTGLLNAAAWQREAAAEISRALRAGEPLALLLADVDHFKRVNDTHGHLAGDEVLRNLATELRQQLRDCDLAGRFGGEEFVALLHRTGTGEACKIAERLRRRARLTNVRANGVTVNVTISIGVAVLGAGASDLPGLLAAADLALYRAKGAGRDQVCLYSADGRYPARPGAADSTGKPPATNRAAGRAGRQPPLRWSVCRSLSTRCVPCAWRTATRSSSTTSRCRSCLARRSASWDRTVPANPRC
ncbi:MAG TPA: GGDEF domain-containing protein [Streptosporangiaceae bacterium]|nr:GGDEF domain-containing protein [Streptosporangiaceae bacterium]